MRLGGRTTLTVVLTTAVAAGARAQTALTWPEIRARFLATNPTLQAGRVGIEESRAAETTAFLRPNPAFSMTFDQIGTTTEGNVFSASILTASVSYLHERQHKRELRRDSARGATAIAVSAQSDLERNLIFNLRTAFVQVLQAKAFLALARDNLTSYDQLLAVSRDRLQHGDIAQIDLDRLNLQRVQYESDVQTAEVNLRTAKIQLLRLLNDQTTPVEQFDVSGPYDFAEFTLSLEDVRRIAFEARPDLRAALQGIDKATIDHRLAFANGSSDPTINVDAAFPSISQAFLGYQPPLREFVGVGVTIPIRVFDRNQGEKLRTELDITRNRRLAEATQLQAFADVDGAYTAVQSAVTLLRSYRAVYLDQATRVRETVTFSYQRGGASLLDFLQAQQEYRSVQIGYVNLVAAYLTAIAQLDFAVGREVVP